jgi:hypothetical protein
VISVGFRNKIQGIAAAPPPSTTISVAVMNRASSNHLRKRCSVTVTMAPWRGGGFGVHDPR